MKKIDFKLGPHTTSNKISSLYEGLDVKKQNALFYNFIFVLRRLLFAMSSVLLD